MVVRFHHAQPIINQSIKFKIMRKVYFYNSIGSFANDVNNAKTSKLFVNGRGDDLSSQEIDDSGWHGTRNYEDADKLLIEGDHLSAEKIRESGIIRSPKRTDANRPIPTTSRVGYMVHIPNYLRGLPNNMIADKQVIQKQKVITIVVAEAVNCGWSATELAEVNAKIVTAIRMIESGGIRCNLYTIFGSSDEGEEIGALIKIKDSGKYLSIEKMAYAMVNPSFFRRHFFRFLETRPELTKGWVWGYGRPADVSLCKKMLKDENLKYHYLCHVGDLKDYSPEDIKKMFEEGNYTE